MSIETLSFVMIFCDGIFIVIVLSVTFVILSKIGIRMISPGPLTPVHFPKKKITTRSYSFTTFSDNPARTMRTIIMYIISELYNYLQHVQILHILNSFYLIQL